MYLLSEEVTNIFTFSTVLNDLRIIICLRKSKLILKEAQFVMTVIIKLIEHGIHCLPCSYINDVINILP